MTTTLKIAGLEITTTAHSITDEQGQAILANITRVAERAETSAKRRGLSTSLCIIEAVDAAIGFNNPQYATTTVSYRNA